MQVRNVSRVGDGKLIPKTIIMNEYFSKELSAIIEVESIADATQGKLDELIEEHSGEGEALFEFLDENNTLVNKDIEKAVKDLRKDKNTSEEAQVLFDYIELMVKIKEQNKLTKQFKAELDEKTIKKYKELSDVEILELLVNKKWYYSLFKGIEALYTAISHEIANRIVELAERYEDTLPDIESEVIKHEFKVKSHLERMGFTW